MRPRHRGTQRLGTPPVDARDFVGRGQNPSPVVMQPNGELRDLRRKQRVPRVEVVVWRRSAVVEKTLSLERPLVPAVDVPPLVWAF
jgi:hypothetical protein